MSSETHGFSETFIDLENIENNDFNDKSEKTKHQNTDALKLRKFWIQQLASWLKIMSTFLNVVSDC